MLFFKCPAGIKARERHLEVNWKFLVDHREKTPVESLSVRVEPFTYACRARLIVAYNAARRLKIGPRWPVL